jgi:O-acetyl-ADP-ribose deacetylase (regulator of RNase III)
MKEYKQIKGDVTEPIGEGNKIIIHCCNDIFVMGSGVALAIKRKWPLVYKKYKEWRNQKPQLGDVQFVKVESNIAVGNILGQHGIGFINGEPPIRYGAIDRALGRVGLIAKKNNASVHLPFKMGADRAGGEWSKIEEMIKKNLCEQDIEVIIYEFNQVDNSLNRREEWEKTSNE